jgi:hypothetical protein
LINISDFYPIAAVVTKATLIQYGRKESGNYKLIAVLIVIDRNVVVEKMPEKELR